MKSINPYSEGTQKHRIFNILSDLKWHCSECELPGSQPAKALQGLRQDGFELEKVGSNWAKNMYCSVCERKTPHRRLISLDKVHEPIRRVALSPMMRKRIIALYDGKDEILGYAPTGRKIEIDHRVPEVRWDDSEQNLDNSALDSELTSRYMLLVREHNLLKSRFCERCKKTSVRQPFLGINYFYQGDNIYLGSCIGCGWFHPSHWKASLNRFISEADNQ